MWNDDETLRRLLAPHDPAARFSGRRGTVEAAERIVSGARAQDRVPAAARRPPPAAV